MTYLGRPACVTYLGRSACVTYLDRPACVTYLGQVLLGIPAPWLSNTRIAQSRCSRLNNDTFLDPRVIEDYCHLIQTRDRSGTQSFVSNHPSESLLVKPSNLNRVRPSDKPDRSGLTVRPGHQRLNHPIYFGFKSLLIP